MRIRVRLFAIQRELAGTREVALDLADGATIEDGWTALVGRLPGPGARAGRRSASPGTATTRTPTTALADGDEVALHPAGQRRRRRAGPDDPR